MARRAWLVPAAAAAGVLPLAKLGLDALLGGLGANPIETLLNRLGFWTLTLLTLTLAATPLHDRLGLAWPVRLRRTLGLLTFAYAALHLVAYAAVDQGFDARAIWADVAKRPFITVGFATFLLLLPLAVTSTDGWVRRLGFRRWKALHRLAYLAALGGVLHFVWRVKVDLRRPLLFAAILGLALVSRLLPRRRGRATGAPAA
jgi:sulfoxide reductase heme-binding subunit YedZ